MHGFRSISLPSRGAFHLSLTVLVHYRSSKVFSLGGWSPQLPTGFLVSRGTQAQDGSLSFLPTGLSPAMVARSRDLRLRSRFVTPWVCGSSPSPGLQPPWRIGPPSVKRQRFRLIPVRSPLLGESRLMYFPRGTKMFQFPHLPSQSLCVQLRDHRPCRRWGCPIRESPANLARQHTEAFRSLATPFIGL